VFPPLIAVAAFVVTIVGGLVALRLRDKLHLILGFSAGAVVGVALFDLLPEAIDLGRDHGINETLPLWLAAGFVVYMILDRLAPMHGRFAVEPHRSSSRLKGTLGAGSLMLHSFLDGLGIGIGLHLSPSVGAVIAAAVLAHDFSDGINTMNMVLKNDGSRAQGLRWLVADALAPAAGIAASYLMTIPAQLFGMLLALFAGFFLYIGASDLVPESYHRHPKALTTATTLLGMMVIYGATKFAM
jgi:ZIP family zinc transporter